jgi:hypothetical protein
MLLGSFLTTSHFEGVDTARSSSLNMKLPPLYVLFSFSLYKELKADKIVLAKIDASAEENSEVAQRFGIRGFPTLKIFRYCILIL